MRTGGPMMWDSHNLIYRIVRSIMDQRLPASKSDRPTCPPPAPDIKPVARNGGPPRFGSLHRDKTCRRSRHRQRRSGDSRRTARSDNAGGGLLIHRAHPGPSTPDLTPDQWHCQSSRVSISVSELRNRRSDQHLLQMSAQLEPSRRASHRIKASSAYSHTNIPASCRLANNQY